MGGLRIFDIEWHYIVSGSYRKHLIMPSMMSPSMPLHMLLRFRLNGFLKSQRYIEPFLVDNRFWNWLSREDENLDPHVEQRFSAGTFWYQAQLDRLP